MSFPRIAGRFSSITTTPPDMRVCSGWFFAKGNFISATEAPKILKDMQDRFLDMAPGYFGHPDFAARFIRGKFSEKQELQRGQRLDTRQDDHS
jgi:hypothetical protein